MSEHEPQGASPEGIPLNPELQRIAHLELTIEHLNERLNLLEDREQRRAVQDAQLANIADRLSQDQDRGTQNLGAEMAGILSARAEDRPRQTPAEEPLTRRQKLGNLFFGRSTDPTEATTQVRSNPNALTPRDPRENAENKNKRRGFGRIAKCLGITALAAAVIGGGVALANSGDNEKAPAAVTTTKDIDKASNDTTITKDGPAPSLVASAGKKIDLGLVKPLTSIETASAADKKDPAPKLEWVNSGSVDKAVLRIKSANDTQLKSNIHKIYDAHAMNNSNAHGKMAALKSFTAESTTKADAVEAANLAAVSEMAYATPLYNNLKGLDADTPATVSHKDMLKFIEHEMTAKGTKFENARISGAYQNHGIKDGKLFAQGLQANNIRVVRMIAANGNEVIFKIGGGNDASGVPCINILEKVNATAVTYQSTYTHSTTRTPTIVETFTPAPTPGHHVPKPNHGKDHTPTTDKPVADQPTDSTDHTPTTEKPKSPEKVAKPLPVGNGDPAEGDHGTPDKAGTAPAVAGDSPADVPRQPQVPIPTPQQPNSVNNNSPAAETGQGPANTDPKGTAPVPGVGTTPAGQGGQVDPSTT